MKTYLISYDLNRVGQNYPSLYKAITAYTHHINAMDSLWVIKTTETAAQIYDKLAGHIDANDFLLVSELNPNHRGWVKKEVIAFLDAPVYR